MVEWSGNSCFPAAAATGRLVMMGEEPRDGTFAAILLWQKGGMPSDSLLTEAVGIVIPSGLPEEEIENAARLAKAYRIPAIKLSVSSENVLRYSGKIAMINAQKGKLIVEPDVRSIRSFMNATLKRREQRGAIMLTDTDTDCRAVGADGIVIHAADGESEEALFERLCDCADKNAGAEMVAAVSLETDDESLVAQISAVYRAGAWGRFSLLGLGARGGSDTQRYLRAVSIAFDYLRKGKREFNGAIRKGLSIETPLMLLFTPHKSAMDFFAVDFKGLNTLLSGSDIPSIGEGRSIELITALSSRIQPAGVYAYNAEEIERDTLEEMLSSLSNGGIYVSRAKAEELLLGM